jgi:glycosyltransferase involved in cell wall biosynthesis
MIASGYDAPSACATALPLPQVKSRHAAVHTIPAAASSTPLTIVQVIPDLQAGGAGASVVQVAEALVTEGHRAIVVSEGGRMEAELARIGATFVRLPVASKSPKQILANGRRIAAIARDAHADVLHAQSRAPAWSCLLAGKLAAIPYVATCDNLYGEQNPLKRLYNTAIVRGARVIALGDALARMIEERYGTPRSKIAVVERGVDLSAFDRTSVSEERIDALARNWGVTRGDRVVLLPGRLTRRKGADTLVAAARRLREAGLKNFVIVLVGEEQAGTRYAAELWDRVHQSELSEFVRIVGHCGDMPAAYALADIAVSTVLKPGGPQRAMLEAQAMGTPVVVSDAGGREEILLAPPFVSEDRATGLLYPAGDAAELAQTLFKVLAMGAPARSAMGMRGHAFVASHYPRQAFTQRILSVYAEVAEARR